MIKTILSTLILATVSLTASAEYMVKIPLEVSKGGTLPNGSISFVTPVVEPEAPAEPDMSGYETPLSVLIQNSGNNVRYNGIIQPAIGNNLDTSRLDLGTNKFFLGNYWNAPQYTTTRPIVGGLIVFVGKDAECEITVASNNGTGTNYTCSGIINFTPDNDVVSVLLYRKK